VLDGGAPFRSALGTSGTFPSERSAHRPRPTRREGRTIKTGKSAFTYRAAVSSSTSWVTTISTAIGRCPSNITSLRVAMMALDSVATRVHHRGGIDDMRFAARRTTPAQPVRLLVRKRVRETVLHEHLAQAMQRSLGVTRDVGVDGMREVPSVPSTLLRDERAITAEARHRCSLRVLHDRDRTRVPARERISNAADLGADCHASLAATDRSTSKAASVPRLRARRSDRDELLPR
jgi:hypothetical protein